MQIKENHLTKHLKGMKNLAKIVQYLWVEHNYCFEKQEFNFSLEYSVHYDEGKHQLKITKNDNFIPNFFGKKIDVTAVVGKNGTGKTSLLHYISSINYYNGLYSNIHGNCIIIFNENNVLKVFCSPQIKRLGIECDYEINELLNKDKFISNEYFKDIRYEYFTPVFSKSDITNSENFGGYTNLSTYNILKKNNKVSIEYFFLDEFSKQIRFFSEFKDKITNFGINYPRYVIVWFNNNKNGIEEVYKKANQGKDLNETDIKCEVDKIIEKCFPEKNVNYELLFKEKIACSMTLSIINRLKKSGLETLECKQLLELIEKSFGNGRIVDTELQDPFEELKAFLSNLEYKYCFQIKAYQEFINYIETSIVIKDTAALFNLKALRFFMSVYRGQDEYTVDVDASLIEFVQKYKETIDEDDYLLFEWKLSSGEMLLLTAYARFYDEKIKNINRNIKNRIVLLDEAEVSFHPEWQRIYLSNMLKFFMDLYNDCHIQLIIATHSPIILSDIPKQNIIYLSKDEKGSTKVDLITEHEETFGANVYKLYNNAFFMDNGAVGEFAKEYICKIKEDIDNSSKSYEKIVEDISIIGDEFIRDQLYLYLNKKRKNPKNNIDKLLDQMNHKEKEALIERLLNQLEQQGD